MNPKLPSLILEPLRSPEARLLGELNEILRRFLQYQGEAEWISIVLDGSAKFASETALFAVRGTRLELRGCRGLDLAPDVAIETGTASAFENALASKDVVVTLRTAREVSPALASADTTARACLFPVVNGGRIAAVLYAAQAQNGVAAGLELVCGMAALVLQRQANAATALQIAATPKQATASPKPERKLPLFADLSEKERGAHLAAQRFARVKVAEMQLAHPEAARAGREQNDVYLFLKKEIDAARESYQKQFGTHRGMSDYLHHELVRSLVDGNEEKLGEEYPSQLD